VLCPESLRLQAYFDAELDAMSVLEIERHIECCAECRTQHQWLVQLRADLRRNLSPLEIPPALLTRIDKLLDAERGISSPHPAQPQRGSWRTRSFWVGAGSGLGTAAIAAMLAVLWVAPSLTNPVADQLVSAHVNSLLSTHLIDVASTDQHTVKPWFAGHTDVSPVVADFEPEGYKLIGGRIDYLEHQRAAVVVYRHGPHVINVFSWAGERPAVPENTTRNGYHLVFWASGNLEYCAVSDTGWDELLGLVRLLKDREIQDPQEVNR
jgi:anti-sigma factor RsiW